MMVTTTIATDIPKIDVYATEEYTRVEPTTDDIVNHNNIVYSNLTYTGKTTIACDTFGYNIQSASDSSTITPTGKIKYCVPKKISLQCNVTSSHGERYSWDWIAYTGSTIIATSSNNACSYATDAIKESVEENGWYIVFSCNAQTYQTSSSSDPNQRSNSGITVVANSLNIETAADPYIKSNLSDITTVVEEANLSLNGFASFPCTSTYEKYQWQYAPANTYADVTTADADKTDTNWFNCSGDGFVNADSTMLTINHISTSWQHCYFRCKYSTTLPVDYPSYSNVTQLQITPASLIKVQAKSFGKKGSNYSPNIGDTLSTEDITVTTSWNNGNIIDKDGDDTSLKGKIFFVDADGKEISSFTFDKLGEGTVTVVYDEAGADGNTASVADAFKSTLAYNVTDTTAPSANPVVNSKVTTDLSDTADIKINASDNYTKASDIQYQLVKYASDGKTSTVVSDFAKVGDGVCKISSSNGNGTYGIIVKDEFGNTSKAFTFPVQIWDNTAPIINSSITPDTSKPSTYRMIKLNASDGDASNTNIVNNSFKYFIEPETSGYTVKSFSDINNWSTTDGFIVTKESVYHLYCADKYGNMIDGRIDASSLNLDDEPPVVSSSVSNPDSNDAVTVTLKVKDNMSAMTKDSIAITPNDVTLSDGAKDGDWTIYTFATKNMNDYTVKVSDDAGNSTDVVISAGQALSQTFTVKFLSEDGQVLKTENVVYGHSATPPTVEGKEGYTFNGWTGSFQNVMSNTTLYARFTKDSIKYVTVHYNTDGGNSIQDAQVESGSRAPYQKPIKSGYFFNGWYTDSNKGVLYDFGQGVTSETTIYASWSVDKANKLTNAELQDLLDKAKSSVTAQTKTVTVTKTEVKTVAAKDDPNVHKYTDAELQKLLEEARATGYREGSASVKPEKIYIKAQAKAKDNTVTVSEDPRADVDDGDLVSVKFSLPEGRTFTKKLAPGTPIVVLDTDGQHIKDYKAENGLIIDLTNDSDDDIEGYNAYDLNDEYVLKQTCIEDEDTALAAGNESLNAETVTKEDDNNKTSSVNMKTIGIISGISLAGIGLIILMLKRKKKRK